MKKQLYRAAAATVLGLSLTTGVAAADTGNVHHMGHKQQPKHNSSFMLTSSTVTNKNTVNASNTNKQVAQSGKAVVVDNKQGGDAATGNAKNSNVTNAGVQIDTTSSYPAPSTPAVDPSDGGNGGSYGGNNGSNSKTVVNTSTVTNTNNVTVTNSNDQYASTGDAVVAHNKDGGSATTGNASNSNSSTFDISVSD